MIENKNPGKKSRNTTIFLGKKSFCPSFFLFFFWMIVDSKPPEYNRKSFSRGLCAWALRYSSNKELGCSGSDAETCKEKSQAEVCWFGLVWFGLLVGFGLVGLDGR